MKTLSFVFAIIFFISPTSALDIGGGGGTPCGSCDSLVLSLPLQLQASGKEIQNLLEVEADAELDILAASEEKACEQFNCRGLEPRIVSRLAASVKGNRRDLLSQSRLDKQFWLGFAVNFMFAFAALILGVLNFRKPK
jgi:hypothetical protein